MPLRTFGFYNVRRTKFNRQKALKGAFLDLLSRSAIPFAAGVSTAPGTYNICGGPFLFMAVKALFESFLGNKKALFAGFFKRIYAHNDSGVNFALRLSTDIDIIVEPGTDVEKFVMEAARIFPFKHHEKRSRKGKNRIEKAHYKFMYASPILKKDF